jgi:NADH dehydrogenase (ubiquinone) 1 alpha subcomplex subunit 9
MHSPQVPGTFSLPGPETFTIEYLLEFVQSVAYLPPSRLPHFPKALALAIAKLAQAPWFPLISPDEVERRYIDDSDVADDWQACGVRPDRIEDHGLAILRRFRSACVLFFWFRADFG